MRTRLDEVVGDGIKEYFEGRGYGTYGIWALLDHVWDDEEYDIVGQ